MSFSAQTNFVGRLSGKTVEELNRGLDYQKVHLKDRMEVVEGVLAESEFYEEYFSDYFKANITSQEALSEDVNVCRSLSRMADYILNSKEVKEEEDKEVVKHVFYTDEKYFKRKVGKEIGISDLVGATGVTNEEQVIHFLKRPEQNHRKEKIQKIVDEDLKRTDFLGQVLNDYKRLSDYLSAELKSKDYKHNRYILSRVKGQTESDMIYCKDVLSGVFAYKPKNVSESTEPDYDIFDFTDKDQLLGKLISSDSSGNLKVKGLLYFKPQPLINGDFALVLHDLGETIKKANLTEREKYVLSEIQDGSPNIKISHDLQIAKMEVTRIIERIAKKVIKVGNKYDKQY
jgi:hypothetical protein